MGRHFMTFEETVINGWSNITLRVLSIKCMVINAKGKAVFLIVNTSFQSLLLASSQAVCG